MKKARSLFISILLLAALIACTNQSESDSGGLIEIEGRVSASQNETAHAIVREAANGLLENVRKEINALKDTELDQTLIDVLTIWHEYDFQNEEDLKMVKSLLQRGADPNAKNEEGDPALFLVHDADMLKVIAEDKRTNIYVKSHGGSTLILRSLGRWDMERLDYLLKKGADPNEDGNNARGETWTPVHFAIQYHEYPEPYTLLKRLLQEPDLDLSVKNDEGMTPLEFAKHLEKEEAVALLKERMEE